MDYQSPDDIQQEQGYCESCNASRNFNKADDGWECLTCFLVVDYLVLDLIYDEDIWSDY